MDRTVDGPVPIFSVDSVQLSRYAYESSVGSVKVLTVLKKIMPIFKAFSKLKQFDAYPKTIEDFRIKTLGGATGERYIKIASFTGYLMCCTCMFYLQLL